MRLEEVFQKLYSPLSGSLWRAGRLFYGLQSGLFGVEYTFIAESPGFSPGGSVELGGRAVLWGFQALFL